MIFRLIIVFLDTYSIYETKIERLKKFFEKRNLYLIFKDYFEKYQNIT